MMLKSRALAAIVMASVALVWVCNAGARNLTVTEKCAKRKADATAALLRCLVREKAKSVQRACEEKHSKRFEKAEDRAASKGEQCPTVDDASEIQKRAATFVDVLLGDTDVFNCTQDTDGRVDCLVNVAADTPSFDLSTDLLSAAQEVNSSISKDTTLWIQAWGGGGGNGATAKGGKTGKGGKGGYAQTVTTISDIGDGTLNPLITTTAVSVAIGSTGCHESNKQDGGGGGSGTAVYVLQSSGGGMNFETIVSAGGGGGASYAQGAAGPNGRDGGDGAVAIATDTAAASVEGHHGDGSHTGEGGNSEGDGNGGSGGSGSDAADGSSGSDGLIGLGAKSVYGCHSTFVLVDENDESNFTGKGGVGGNTTTHNVSGGSGGGGFGGGGGGAGVDDGANPGGGGGAGSFASQNTRSDPDAPSSADDVDLSRSQGQILFTFNP